MPTNHDFKADYERVLQQFIKGSVLVKVKAKRLYNYFASWVYGKDYVAFDDLPIQEQKAWVMTSYKIPAQVEWDESDADDEAV